MFTTASLTILFATSACFGFVVEPRTSSDTRIVGGMDAAEGQFPWIVSLRTKSDNQHRCGGSVLNSKWILTAAHCFFNITNPEDVFIVAGSIFLSDGTAYDISGFTVHEDYHDVSSTNDVAVLSLAEELQFSEFVQPIELNTEFVEVVDSVLAGWGSLYYFGPLSENLQYINIRTITNEECREFPTPYPEIFVSDDEICTFSSDEEISACNGDSGGPLVSDGKQIGIVSWGTSPCTRDGPEVYVRVSSFIEWINDAISG